ncbi:MAG: stage III sporulation protein AE, partial [Clostridiales bacterium]|nr:stage III sporulation protein AE [Clostridiales bacterium]
AVVYTSEQEDAVGVAKLEQALPESARQTLKSAKVSSDAKLDDSLQKIWNSAKSKIPNIFKTALSSAFAMFAISAICGICATILANSSSAAIGSRTPNYVSLAGSAAITLTSAANIKAMLGLCTKTIADVSVFSKVLMPTVATATAMGGMPTSGTAQCFGTMLFSEFLITLINRVILPLVYAYIALIAANAALSNDLMKKTAGFIKWICSTSLKLLLTVFVAYISVSGAIAGSADAFAVKTLKVAVSGALPVVGSVLGDASESMLAGAGMLKNSIGVYGMIAILAMCFTPLITSGIHYLVYKAAAAISAPVCPKELGELMDGIGDSFGLAFGMLCGCLTLFCISLIVAIAFLRPS